MSLAKIRLPLGIIATIVGIGGTIFPLIETWKWPEARWTTYNMTIGVVMLIGIASLVFGSYCISRDMDKLEKVPVR